MPLFDLSNNQTKLLGERVIELLDDTEDWNGTDEEFTADIQSWIDILKALGQTKQAEKIKKDYKSICNKLT